MKKAEQICNWMKSVRYTKGEKKAAHKWMRRQGKLKNPAKKYQYHGSTL